MLRHLAPQCFTAESRTTIEPPPMLEHNVIAKFKGSEVHGYIRGVKFLCLVTVEYFAILVAIADAIVFQKSM